MPLNDGEVFAGYVIQRLLGTGGMGEVYLAQHPRLPRLDALKVLSLAATADAEFRVRFNREADLAATLFHPHIVGVHDRGEFNGRLWISMNYVDGTDTGQLLKARYSAGMPENDVGEIVTSVADALDMAHENNLLHRDVKPENILVTMPSPVASLAQASDGHRRRVLLTDFGIARRIDDVSNLTEANVAMGTVNYAAPEQLLGKALDGRADQYALAATTFHLLTGAPPFHDENRAVVVSHHLSTPPPRVSERRPDLAHLDAVLTTALAKDPNERYPKCIDFARALTQQRSSRPGAESLASGERPVTQRLDRMVVRGTARGVKHTSVGGEHQIGILSFWVEPSEPTGDRPAPIRVEIQTQLVAGQLTDGDAVEVSGVWDGDTLEADTIVNVSPAVQPRPARDTVSPPGDQVRKSRKARMIALAAIFAVIAVVLAAVVYVTDGFGHWTRLGPVVKPVSAAVFAPSANPDNPGLAELAIDGDPATAWSTVTYTDAVPFPNFIEGMGLLLQLSEATALSAVTIEVSSTGTEVQIRSAPSADPTSLAETTELTPAMPLQPGSNRIPVKDPTETSNVLVWITTLGTTDGQSRTAISDITLYAGH